MLHVACRFPPGTSNKRLRLSFMRRVPVPTLIVTKLGGGGGGRAICLDDKSQSKICILYIIGVKLILPLYRLITRKVVGGAIREKKNQ